jgi:hypothetical protein
MTFMTPPASAASNNEPRMPILGFNAKSGRLLLLDRVQDAAGEWSSRRDSSAAVQQLPFLVDFGRLEIGWIHFSANQAPIFALAPYGEQGPAMPVSPGTNNNGRPLRFKAGFRLPVISNAIGGMREFSGNSAALINGMNELHSAYEAAPEARAGQIPAVRLTDVVEIEAGQSSNYQPVFAIIGWSERPAALGPRTVPAPGTTAQPLVPTRTATAASPAPALRAPAPSAESWTTEPAPRPAAVNGRHTPAAPGWADSEIPF